MKINKAVVPLAGCRVLGLPAVGRGNMLSIVEKPALGYPRTTVKLGLRHLAAGNNFRAFFRNLPFISSAPTLQLAAVLPQATEAIAIAG